MRQDRKQVFDSALRCEGHGRLLLRDSFLHRGESSEIAEFRRIQPRRSLLLTSRDTLCHANRDDGTSDGSLWKSRGSNRRRGWMQQATTGENNFNPTLMHIRQKLCPVIKRSQMGPFSYIQAYPYTNTNKKKIGSFFSRALAYEVNGFPR